DAGECHRTADERNAARREDPRLGPSEASTHDRDDRDERGDREENRRPQPEEAANAHFAAALLFAAALRAFLRMNSSVNSYASSSTICFGGDFMRYELGPMSEPATPLLSASFAIRTASMTMPAEFGESQTSSLSSTFSGTSPNEDPSMRMYAHLRSVSHGT